MILFFINFIIGYYFVIIKIVNYLNFIINHNFNMFKYFKLYFLIKQFLCLIFLINILNYHFHLKSINFILHIVKF